MHLDSRVLLAALAGTLANGAAAQEPVKPAAQPAAPVAKAATPEGLLPLVDYSGDLWSRSRVLGDWGGPRTDLARKGVMLDLDWTQSVQGVVSGGRRIDWDYGGSLDAALTLDLHRMKVMPGALVRLRVEGRYGESINDDAGSLLPVNTDLSLPITGRVNESIVSITELNYTQFLGETFGLTLGKFQTMDGDPNEFASGRGRTQFMNFNFIQNGIAALTIPYSTVGGGVVWLPTDKIMVSSLVVTTKDSSTTSGFENTDDGWTWVTEGDFQYRLGTLPGGCNVGFAYAFDGNFAQLGGHFQYVRGQGLALARDGDSWAFFASAWQYLYTADEPAAGKASKIDTSNGKADLRGVGLFARVGFADKDTNPIEWTASGGLGGRGLIPSRDNDTWGVGYVYSSVREAQRRLVARRFEDATQAFEAYYNIALTPAVGLTCDIQWQSSLFQLVNDATIVGFRFDVRF